MKESFCEILLDYLPSDSELEDFYLTTIANCVLNSLLSYIAIMLNIAKIHAVRKTSSLPQVLSHSSPSQIPGTCDSRACCGCGDLNVDVKYNWSFFNIFCPTGYLLTYYGNFDGFRCHSYNYGLRQDLFSR